MGKREPLPIRRVETRRHRVDIYGPLDGVYRLELVSLEPVRGAGFGGDLKGAEEYATVMLERAEKGVG